MRTVIASTGAVLTVLGAIWFLRGVNVLPGSFMTGQMQWAVYSGIAFVAGVVMIVVTRRKAVARHTPVPMQEEIIVDAARRQAHSEARVEDIKKLGKLVRVRKKRSVSVDKDIARTTTLRRRKITLEDLPVFHQCRIRTWDHRAFDDDIVASILDWVVNDDRSVVLMGLGGGAFEIPVMYDLIYRGNLIRLECGGGGERAEICVKHEDESYDVTLIVSSICLSPELLDEQDAVMELAAEALAAEYAGYRLRSLTVKYN